MTLFLKTNSFWLQAPFSSSYPLLLYRSHLLSSGLHWGRVVKKKHKCNWSDFVLFTYLLHEFKYVCVQFQLCSPQSFVANLLMILWITIKHDLWIKVKHVLHLCLPFMLVCTCAYINITTCKFQQWHVYVYISTCVYMCTGTSCMSVFQV